MFDKDEATVTTELSTTSISTTPAEMESLMKLKLNEINSTLADIDKTLHSLLTSQRSPDATLTPGGEI